MHVLRRLLMVVVAVAALLMVREAGAVAFKLKNDSSFTVRARVYDRNAWRPWVTFQPGAWGDFATKVKRTKHDVEIDVWRNGQWDPLYRRQHGSRLFTRVVQVFARNGDLYFAWWDEPPFIHCRDAPPPIGSNGHTCLKPSGGWIFSKFFEYAVKVGRYFLVGNENHNP